MAPSDKQTQRKKTLKEIAEEKIEKNPSQLGDPISLKAETSDHEPTENDRPNKSVAARRVTQNSGAQTEADNSSQIGDPVSLKSETSDNEPTEQDRGALGTNKTGKPKM